MLVGLLSCDKNVVKRTIHRFRHLNTLVFFKYGAAFVFRSCSVTLSSFCACEYDLPLSFQRDTIRLPCNGPCYSSTTFTLTSTPASAATSFYSVRTGPRGPYRPILGGASPQCLTSSGALRHEDAVLQLRAGQQRRDSLPGSDPR